MNSFALFENSNAEIVRPIKHVTKLSSGFKGVSPDSQNVENFLTSSNNVRFLRRTSRLGGTKLCNKIIYNIYLDNSNNKYSRISNVEGVSLW